MAIGQYNTTTIKVGGQSMTQRLTLYRLPLPIQSDRPDKGEPVFLIKPNIWYIYEGS